MDIIDIIALARECGASEPRGSHPASILFYADQLAAFVARIRADQREMDARICEKMINNANDWDSSYWDQAAERCAFAIRAGST